MLKYFVTRVCIAGLRVLIKFYFLPQILDSTLNSQTLQQVKNTDLIAESQGKGKWYSWNLRLFTELFYVSYPLDLVLQHSCKFSLVFCTLHEIVPTFLFQVMCILLFWSFQNDYHLSLQMAQNFKNFSQGHNILTENVLNCKGCINKFLGG